MGSKRKLGIRSSKNPRKWEQFGNIRNVVQETRYKVIHLLVTQLHSAFCLLLFCIVFTLVKMKMIPYLITPFFNLL